MEQEDKKGGFVVDDLSEINDQSAAVSQVPGAPYCSEVYRVAREGCSSAMVSCSSKHRAEGREMMTCSGTHAPSSSSAALLLNL